MHPPSPGELILPGARLPYQLAGEGFPVVLVHGFGLDMRMWDPQFDSLSGRFQLIRYDCRGFGMSGEFDPAISYTHAEDLLALLDHLGVGAAAVCGLSFGGRVAMQTALLAPHRVTALILLGTVLDGVEWDRDSWAAMAKVDEQVRASGVAAGREAWLAHPLFRPAAEDPHLAARLAEMVASYPGQHWLGLDPHRETEPHPIDTLADLRMPTLVISGERDVPCFREMSAVLSAGIPGADSVEVAGSGHMVNMEAPEAVSELIAEFVAGQADRHNGAADSSVSPPAQQAPV
jgi:pimeloyl-ACP methyl ester carboxylesterase